MSDFKILHRNNCKCANNGYVPDALDSTQQCEECDEEFGFGVPIVADEGRLISHLSCVVQTEVNL